MNIHVFKSFFQSSSSGFAACQSDQARAEFVLGLAEVTDTVKVVAPPPDNDKSADLAATYKYIFLHLTVCY